MKTPRKAPSMPQDATRLPRLTEKQFLEQVKSYAKLCGWLVYHTHDSRRSSAGFPDLVLLRGLRLVVAELKSEDGVVRPDQRTWIAAFMGANVSTFVWRPSDWEQIERVLAREQP